MQKEQIEAIIHKATVCRLGMLDGDTPYIVPLCFGYRDNTLYFHGSMQSRKVELIQKHPRVCFEFDILTEPISAPNPCDWDSDMMNPPLQTSSDKPGIELVISAVRRQTNGFHRFGIVFANGCHGGFVQNGLAAN